MAKSKVRPEDLKPGEVLCQYCTGKCCRYFALPIETPTEWSDFEHIRWYMMHGSVSMFVEDDAWYLMVHADCKHLAEDNSCTAYETRPGICREYTTDNCEYDDDASYDRFFESPEQIWEYAEAVLVRKKKPKYRRETPAVSLPILSSVSN